MTGNRRRSPADTTARSCGRHFTSLAAFDRHRAGQYDAHRACVNPRHVNIDARDEGKGEPLNLRGVGECRIAGPGTLRDVEIWEAA